MSIINKNLPKLVTIIKCVITVLFANVNFPAENKKEHSTAIMLKKMS